MAEFGAGEVVRGFISLQPLTAGVVAVYFTATPQVLRILQLPEEDLSPVKILEIDETEDRVRIYPIGTQPTADIYGKPKYSSLRMISIPVDYVEIPEEASDVETVLENLPRGFLKDCQFGLGLAKAYHPIVTAIEAQTKCSQLFLEADGGARVEGHTLFLSLADFEALRAETDRISSRANRAALNVKKASAMNWLARRFGQEEVPYTRGRHPMIQRFADVAADRLDDDGLENLLEIVNEHVVPAAIARPEVVAKLKSDIELVQLDTLIDRFDSMLRLAYQESAWQAFFTENTFILSFAFGYPMILVQDQAVAGGRKISGSGEKNSGLHLEEPSHQQRGNHRDQKAEHAITSA